METKKGVARKGPHQKLDAGPQVLIKLEDEENYDVQDVALFYNISRGSVVKKWSLRTIRRKAKHARETYARMKAGFEARQTKEAA